jgi:hypothetical protein
MASDLQYIYKDAERWVVRNKEFDVSAKIFSFVKFGGKEFALNAAKDYRDEQQDRLKTAIVVSAPAPAPSAAPKPKKIIVNEYYEAPMTQEWKNSIRHTKEGLQMNWNECRAYHFTGGWDYAFGPSCQGHSSWREKDWSQTQEHNLRRFVIETLTPTAQRLPWAKPWINKFILDSQLKGFYNNIQ